MKNILKIFFLALLIGFICAGPSLAMTITPYDSATNIAQSLVGSGVTISNVTYSGASGASGYFTGGTAAGIGIESGIVLTSGLASLLNGTTNTNDGITGNNGGSGYAPLNALVPGYTTHDATVLAFDFTSTGTAAYFNYVFGSDEYNEWVGSAFNDVFGFFFNGTAIADNVALIPGTSTPVSINNINKGANASYYNNNDPSDGVPTPFGFEYDGFTDVFTAAILGLTPGATYHLTLAIADAGDWILDSGVFLQAKSFSDTPVDPGTPVPEPSILMLLGAGLIGLGVAARKKMTK